MQRKSGFATVADPVKGLRLERMDVAVRNIPRSRRLLTQALDANAGARRMR
jgi:hypothetical protein